MARFERPAEDWATGRGFLSALTALVVLAGTYFAWRICQRSWIGVDDANIFFVYAKNFSQGHGIVYNVGGEHVEGFSSFLYFLICSAVYFCFRAAPEVVLFGLNVLFGAATCVMVTRTLCDLADYFQVSRVVRLVWVGGFLLWLLSNPLYFVWNIVSLMDTGIYSVLVVASFRLLTRMTLEETEPTGAQAGWLAGLIALMILVRPEGMVWAGVMLVAFAWICWRSTDSIAAAGKKMVAPIASVVATPAVLVAFRLAYFGYPVPNTYYAKVSSSLRETLADGRGYIAPYMKFYGVVLFVPLLIVCGWVLYMLAKRWREARSTPFTLAMLTAGFGLVALMIPVIEGGDHFGGARMYQPVYPLLFFSVVMPMLLLKSLATVRARVAYAVVLAVLIGVTTRSSWHGFDPNGKAYARSKGYVDGVLVNFTLATEGRLNTMRLHDLLGDELPTIGVGSAGGQAYSYAGTTYDLLGLNEVRMAHADAIKHGPKAHASFNKDMFYEIAPDAMLPDVVAANEPLDLAAKERYYMDPVSWDNQIFKGIFNDQRFKDTYTLAMVTDAKHPEWKAWGFWSNGYLARLAKDGNVSVVRYAGA